MPATQIELNVITKRPKKERKKEKERTRTPFIEHCGKLAGDETTGDPKLVRLERQRTHPQLHKQPGPRKVKKLRHPPAPAAWPSGANP
jgi:hypothetical protein